ncbi:MAG: SUMF1/EgtB/PvdO family nonheme iron enzyme [Chloroflexota bacterium]
MRLTRKTRNRVRDLLVNHVPASTTARESLVRNAFFGSPLIKQIEYGGNSDEFATHLIDRCLKFGKLSDGEHALEALLEEIGRGVGVDVRADIDDMIAAMTRPPPAPPQPDVKPAQSNEPVGTQFIASEPEPKPAAPPVVEVVDKVVAADRAGSVSTKSGDVTAAELTRLTLEILPGPFAWIDIPGGWVTIDGHGEYDVKPFMMAKYPVTNAQFAMFMHAGGYNKEGWWGDGLWNVRQQQGWTLPRYWQDSDYNSADHPVVGVSWYEAIAFTRWLNDTVGTRNGASGNITLPTEMQWQRAAQGDDGRTWPWGSKFHKNRANTYESGIGKMTPVTQYEGKGDSPYGVVDMSGNVWHWCLNTIGQPENISIDAGGAHRVLRGGAWNHRHINARAARRNFISPGNRFSNLGFLLVRLRLEG